LQEGITLHEEVDEVTGLSRHVVAESPDEKRQPAIVIKGKATRRYLMPKSRINSKILEEQSASKRLQPAVPRVAT